MISAWSAYIEQDPEPKLSKCSTELTAYAETGDQVQLYLRNENTRMAVASSYVNIFQSTLFIGLVFMFVYMML